VNGATLQSGVIVVKEARAQLRQSIANGDCTTRIPGVIAVKGARANLHRASRFTLNGATKSKHFAGTILVEGARMKCHDALPILNGTTVSGVIAVKDACVYRHGASVTVDGTTIGGRVPVAQLQVGEGHVSTWHNMHQLHAAPAVQRRLAVVSHNRERAGANYAERREQCIDNWSEPDARHL
jgi:hypothetical protein